MRGRSCWYCEIATAAPASRPLTAPTGSTEDTTITSTSPAAEYAPPAPGAQYLELKRRVTAAGLMRPRQVYYALLIAANTIGFLALFALLGIFGGGWTACVIAVGLGFVSGQLGFQLHDAGHRQMFRSRRLNLAIGFITANLLLGMSRDWWVDKHNRHHGNPNHTDLDPDIQVGTISYSTEQALGKRGVARVIAAYQAYLFFPLLFGLGWAMHVSGLRFLLARPVRTSAAELAALAIHLGVYIGVLAAFVGPWWAIAVVVIHKCVGGFYLAAVFAPNHKGMPQTSDLERLDFLRAQVLTSRNVRSHPLTDFLYGGLNYQVEHHLFPTMPRRNVRRAHAIVRGYCEEISVPYHETSIVQSYREILGFLNDVGTPLRGMPATV